MASANTMLDPLCELAAKVARSRPAAAMIVWEDDKGRLLTRCVPHSATLARGFMERIYAAMNAAGDTDAADMEAEA